MKRFIVLCCIFSISILSLAGCHKDKDVTNYSYTYRDENDQWEAEYKVEGTITFFTNEKGRLDVESREKNALIVAYKGKLQDLKTVKHVEISYSGALTGGSLSSEYGEGYHINSKVFKLTGGGTGTASAPEGDVIKVTIKLDDWKVQTLELTTAKHQFETY